MTAPATRLQHQLDELANTIPRERLQVISDALRTGYRGGATPTLEDDDHAVGYAVYRMLGTTTALAAVLGRAHASLPDWEPKTALDLGGGTGAGAHAIDRMLPSVHRLLITDRSNPVLELGERIAPIGGMDTRWLQTTDVPHERVDLAVMSYFIGEVAKPKRERLLEDVFDRAETVVVVEPGTEIGYATIIEVRRQMIDAGLAIAAPCPHAGTCPLGADDWCHFVARFDRSEALRRLKGGTHPYDDEKFSYVVGTRRPITPVTNRVLRHPLKRGGHVIVELCRSDGTAGGETISRRHDRYRKARDLRWGDGWDPA